VAEEAGGEDSGSTLTTEFNAIVMNPTIFREPVSCDQLLEATIKP
jgi:hypothetical protein